MKRIVIPITAGTKAQRFWNNFTLQIWSVAAQLKLDFVARNGGFLVWGGGFGLVDLFVVWGWGDIGGLEGKDWENKIQNNNIEVTCSHIGF